MKSITEILGRAQILLAISFDIHHSFEEYLTDDQQSLIAMLRVIKEELPDDYRNIHISRPAYQSRLFI